MKRKIFFTIALSVLALCLSERGVTALDECPDVPTIKSGMTPITINGEGFIIAHGRNRTLKFDKALINGRTDTAICPL